jgi:hypothetical protein
MAKLYMVVVQSGLLHGAETLFVAFKSNEALIELPPPLCTAHDTNK